MDIEEYRIAHVKALNGIGDVLMSIYGQLKLYTKAFQPKLTAAETASLRKLAQEFEDDEDDQLKVSREITLPELLAKAAVDKQEDVFMDLTEVTIVAQTEKALLASKKGYQKWVAFSLITNSDISNSESYLGRYFEELNIKADKEKWFHTKKSWVKFQVRS